jgi:DNA-binding transcriptional ArsR family regulator/uncharacterized protein YndB with AHSA1/START domain
MTYQLPGLAALADPTRREIFERLADRPHPVGELAEGLSVSRPAVSQHLKVLKDAGLVIDRQAGNRRIYRVDLDGLDALRVYLDQFWNRSMAAFKAAAEATRRGGLMTMQATETSVRTSITVETPVERAFTVFTEGIGTWWNPEHHILEGELAEMVFEPRVGGHIYDRGTDGSECRWARVLVYEPPTRLVFSWDINTRWQIETDHEKTSEVEVRFTPEGPDRTYVELEHRKLDRHGEGWEAMRDAVGSPNGWNLQGFADAAKAA